MLALIAAALASDAHSEVRGMTVSCPTWGWEWGSDAMVESLDELAALGVNWVAIHPYARIRADGSLTHGLDPADPPAWITRPIAEAHARGMKVMVKPHIAYWSSPFSWRGEIDFDATGRQRFFTAYRRWIVDMATVSKDADAFVVGTELDALVDAEAEWRAIIGDVRQVHSGHLTYAVNWDNLDDVAFWDAVDAVGVQAYFPIAGANATDEQLQKGWQPVLAKMRGLHDRTGKPVIFTEIGYNDDARAASHPWEGRGHGHRDLQKRCLGAAMRAIEGEPAIAGAFLWKWFPGDQRPGNFDMHAVRGVIEQHWRKRE